MRREKGKHCLPRLAVRVGAAMLMRRDRIVEHDVRRVVLHESVEVAGTEGFFPLVDQSADFEFVSRGGSRCAHGIFSRIFGSGMSHGWDIERWLNLSTNG